MSAISGGGGSVAVNAVTAIDSSNTSTTSSTPAATTTTVTITPSSASAKILIVVSGQIVNLNPSANASNGFIYKDGANVNGSTPLIVFFDNAASGAAVTTSGNMNWLDSPGNTSAHTYAVYISSSAAGQATRWINTNSSVSAVITAIEVH